MHSIPVKNPENFISPQQTRKMRFPFWRGFFASVALSLVYVILYIFGPGADTGLPPQAGPDAIQVNLFGSAYTFFSQFEIALLLSYVPVVSAVNPLVMTYYMKRKYGNTVGARRYFLGSASFLILAVLAVVALVVALSLLLGLFAGCPDC